MEFLRENDIFTSSLVDVIGLSKIRRIFAKVRSFNPTYLRCVGTARLTIKDKDREIMLESEALWEQMFFGENKNFLKKHGVFYYEDLLVGDASSCRDVVMDAKKVKYPLKIDITGKMLANHPINKNIDKVFYNHGSYFKHNKTDGLVASVIAETTKSSGLMMAEKMTDLGYEDLLKNYLYTDEEYTLALLLEGEFRPYYPYPPINDEELLTRLPLYIGKAQKPGKLLLIGDADIVNESLWNANVGVKSGIYDITYSSGNLRFLRNIFDYMSGSGFTNVKRKNTFEQNKKRNL